MHALLSTRAVEGLFHPSRPFPLFAFKPRIPLLKQWSTVLTKMYGSFIVMASPQASLRVQPDGFGMLDLGTFQNEGALP